MSRGERAPVSQNLSLSMRQNYDEHGVEEYYRRVGATYRNPHYPGIKTCLFTWFNKLWEMEGRRGLSQSASGNRVFLFDMACGSGEVTTAFKGWWTAGQEQSILDIRNTLDETMAAPHKAPQGVQQVVVPRRRGIQARAIGPDFPRPLVAAADPFTAEAYKDRTSYSCATLSFKEISEGALPSSYTDIDSGVEENFDATETQLQGESDPECSSEPIIEMVVCSFALHLIQSPSELFALLWELSTKVRWLIILAPHKKPEIKDGWGWMKWDIAAWSEGPMAGQSGELLNERVHCRVYRSTQFT